MSQQNVIERVFESMLWRSRIICYCIWASIFRIQQMDTT